MTAVDRVKYLEMIQAVVARMASNSFLLRGWSVTLVGALLAVSAKEQQARFAVLAFMPAIVFWSLDAFYLRQERLFRGLFNHVRVAADAELSRDPYSMATERINVDSLARTALTPIVAGLHGALVVAIIAIVVSFRG